MRIAERKIGCGPIGERDPGLLIAVGQRCVGHAHERVQRACRQTSEKQRQVKNGGLGGAEARDFVGEERAVVALALALAQKITPILAVDFADRRGNGNQPVLLVVDTAVGFQPIIARAHAMQRDQNHRQVIGETDREFHTPLSRPSHRPLESVRSCWGSSRADCRARRRHTHERLPSHSGLLLHPRRLEKRFRPRPTVS